MALGLKKGGVDWDSILEPRGSSTPRANIGIRKAGVDIAQRYHASTGGDTIGYNLGVRKGGVDVGQFFRRLGYVAAPSISGMSNSSPVYTGESVTLTCTATGTGLSYQWYDYAAALIGGATSSSLTIAAPSSGGSFTYECRVTNGGGTVSGTTSITVYAPPSVSLTGSSSVSSSDFSTGSWSFSASSTVGLLNVRYQVDGHGSGAWAGASGTSYSNSSSWSDPYASPSISHSPGTYLFYFEAEDINHHISRAELYVTVT